MDTSAQSLSDRLLNYMAIHGHALQASCRRREILIQRSVACVWSQWRSVSLNYMVSRIQWSQVLRGA